jgi:hypothetical protein
MNHRNNILRAAIALITAIATAILGAGCSTGHELSVESDNGSFRINVKMPRILTDHHDDATAAVVE